MPTAWELSLLKWDLRFLDQAKLISLWSKDPSTKVGAVIVRPDRTLCSVGFNGFPRVMVDLPQRYADRDEKYPRTIHAEVNALLFAREPVKGYTLYTWPLGPCDRCCVQMLQAGIERFVFPAASEDARQRWGEALVRAKSFMAECGAIWREY